jgi:hypothetical protein
MRRYQSTPVTPTLKIRFYSTRNDRPESPRQFLVPSKPPNFGPTPSRRPRVSPSRRARRSVKLTRIKLCDKMKALDMLARHLGMFPMSERRSRRPKLSAR